MCDFTSLDQLIDPPALPPTDSAPTYPDGLYAAEPSALDPSKPVRTRGGFPARIIATDAAGLYPIIAAVKGPYGDNETAQQFTLEGRYNIHRAVSDDMDLVNIPDRKRLYLNLGNAYAYLAPAERAYPDFAVLQVDIEGGSVVATAVLGDGLVD